ncbi:uncharacterized protein KY384_006367 [Bacidia gigantensis]|uniref:uncharacterized protein n=1 Tax=Bacidia gigantensis TaxID=2732470 RepID=UPI001D04C641|nr:uncharacterized protein KY384_006367 [Bacidia gigantensis]KAG8528680.1 hypothetical protein KY384_006367 [Bacidia gigantensis]
MPSPYSSENLFSRITIASSGDGRTPSNCAFLPSFLPPNLEIFLCVESRLGQNWTVTKIERDFAKRQKQKQNVYAEVQMLMSLNANGSSASGLFPYSGCSKLSCFMCNSFIESYGQFTTRGCHGRLFKTWTVASVDRLLPGQANRTAKALVLVQKGVEKKLKASVEGHIRHERTSGIGESSVSGGRQEERSQRQLQMDRLRMKVERDRAAEMFRRELRSRIPLLESFLSVPSAGPRPFVWDLKQFLEINDPMDHPPILSVNIDYEVVKCRSFEDTCTLMEIYGQVLNTANPLELRQA